MDFACNMCGKKGTTDKYVPHTWGYVRLYRSDKHRGLIPNGNYRICPACVPKLKGFIALNPER